MAKEKFEDVIASQPDEFMLNKAKLDKATREELAALVAKKIAKRIVAGDVTPPSRKPVVAVRS